MAVLDRGIRNATRREWLLHCSIAVRERQADRTCDGPRPEVGADTAGSSRRTEPVRAAVRFRATTGTA